MLADVDALVELLRSRIPDRRGAQKETAQEALIDDSTLSAILGYKRRASADVMIRLLAATGMPKQEALQQVLCSRGIMTASELSSQPPASLEELGLEDPTDADVDHPGVPLGLFEMVRQLGRDGIAQDELTYLLGFVDGRVTTHGAQSAQRWSPDQWFKVLLAHRDSQR